MTRRIGFHLRGEESQKGETPHTFVIVSRGGSGTYQLVINDLPHGARAVRCFLSPLDALIEASCLANSGRDYEVVTASAIDRSAICDDRGQRLFACFHQAWIGRQGRILLRTNGLPVADCRLIRRPPPGELLRFELDADTLEALDEVRQLAGLFAWLETVQDLARWTNARLQGAVQRALRTMPTVERPDTGSEQFVMFDPELGQ
ncbi:hypothetical protein [Paraburkholderia fungorum]|uniref:hypothetical protein n=1 Tax=Paraburkholderia fungorum TaxID=134537 RepID=UPI0038B7A95C